MCLSWAGCISWGADFLSASVKILGFLRGFGGKIVDDYHKSSILMDFAYTWSLKNKRSYRDLLVQSSSSKLVTERFEQENFVMYPTIRQIFWMKNNKKNVFKK